LNTSASDQPSRDTLPAGADKSARWKWLLRLTIGLVIVGALLWRQDTPETRRSLSEIGWQVLWQVLPIAILVYLASQVISATRWRLLLHALLDKNQPRLSVLECARLYLIGMFWSLWMPTSIGGDAVRAFMAGKRCGGIGLAATSIFVERLMGFCTLLCIGAVGLLVGRIGPGQNQNALHLAQQGALVLIVAVAGLLTIRALALRLERSRPEHKIVAKWAELHRTLDLYAHPSRWPALAMAILLSLLVQCLQISLNIGLARVVGLELPATTFLWLVPLLAVASMIPLGVGGLGVREGAAILLLQGSGAPDGRILAWSLLWQATIWLSGLPGAFLASGRLGQRNDEGVP